MPRYAISDIHGCPDTFNLLLKNIGFTKEDELFLLGDYVDRGPDSLGVLQRIWKLEEDGYNLTCLRGNHEQMLLDALKANNFPWDYQPRPQDLARVIDWIDALPYYHETPGYILVHAGLDFHWKDPLQNTEAMLWARYWYGDTNLAWLDGRVVIHGHTPDMMLSIRQGIEYMHQTGRACIDSGCAMHSDGMGYLTALNLDSGEGEFLRRVD